ncbi:unnamed protein product, partial [Prorocentrum cordatum]
MRRARTPRPAASAAIAGFAGACRVLLFVRAGLAAEAIPEYRGCYVNTGAERLMGHISDKSIQWCAAAARVDALEFFGMEWPGNSETEGNAACLTLAGSPALAEAPDEECEDEVADGHRLGGRSRLAVYATSPLEVSTTELQDGSSPVVDEQLERRHRR